MELHPVFLSLLFTPLAVAAETWKVTKFYTHYMAENSGTENGTWPAGSEFNTTVCFTLSPTSGSDQKNIECQGTFAPFTHDTLWRYCDGDVHAWRLEPGHFEAVSMWGLNILRSDVEDSTVRTTYAQFHMVNNEPENPQSFLTCTEGKPLEGWSCALDGQLSVPSPVRFPLYERQAHAKPFKVSNFTIDRDTGRRTFSITDPNVLDSYDIGGKTFRSSTECKLGPVGHMLKHGNEDFLKCDDESFSFKLGPSNDTRGMRGFHLEVRHNLPLASFQVDVIAPSESIISGSVDLEFGKDFNYDYSRLKRSCALTLTRGKAEVNVTSLAVAGSYGLP
ncbi:hypothetical protein P152DRAFT_514255 [Eremomyces bilateralis CBS 781.70]|uniref:Uncharacterized protein n=1 Tax=Eremomyces bilateralis CBS 781.70 TaxID=1392243 RepID=A0A6G1G3L3_9PEZI|nr:uncharacterized protein P152DRAFT_514255 [Eremomyces bilateralis CBS 781.70]KAF1812654.1 hypothetical protein P152DRAFT_514255 [Eremomyces bilateralis CBS 781.70]